MPCDLTWESSGVVRRFTGIVTGPDLIGSATSIHADPRFDALRYVINDALGATGLAIDDEDFAYAAALDVAAAMTNPDIRIAVVSRSPVAAERTRQYTSISGGAYLARLFDDVGAARAWLGCPPR